jgi:hypothetical protein
MGTKALLSDVNLDDMRYLNLEVFSFMLGPQVIREATLGSASGVQLTEKPTEFDQNLPATTRPQTSGILCYLSLLHHKVSSGPHDCAGYRAMHESN